MFIVGFLRYLYKAFARVSCYALEPGRDSSHWFPSVRKLINQYWPSLVGGFKFQPIWKIFVNLDHPQLGVNIKNLWNHQPCHLQLQSLDLLVRRLIALLWDSGSFLSHHHKPSTRSRLSLPFLSPWNNPTILACEPLVSAVVLHHE